MPDPIRVAIVQPALPAYRVPVFRELAGRPGLEVTVYHAEQSDLANAEASGFRAEPVSQRAMLGGRLILAPTVWRLASRRRADVLVAGWNTRSVLLPPALLRARLGRVGTVLWGHGYSKSEGSGRRGLRDRLGGLADSVVFYNHGAAEAFRARNPRHRGVFVAANSLDQDEIQRAREDWLRRPADLASFRSGHRLHGPTALFVSRLLEENRVDLLLRATAAVDELTTVIIGKGPDRERLETLARDLGIAERVRFTGAIYGEDAIAPWFLAADVFVYPVNIGLSIMHALGYGVPVVTSDHLAGHNPEIEALQPGVNGLLYRDGDLDALADAIRAIVNDPPRREAMGEAARRTVLERFNIPRMVDGLEAAIRHAAG